MTLQALPWLLCRMHGVLPVLRCRNPVLQTILAALHGEQGIAQPHLQPAKCHLFGNAFPPPGRGWEQAGWK